MIEQGFVGILDITQIDMSIDIISKSAILLIRALALLFNSFNNMGSKPCKLKLLLSSSVKAEPLFKSGNSKSVKPAYGI